MTIGRPERQMLLLVAALGGCDVGINGGLTGFGEGQGGADDMSAATAQTGLPCDVARILSDNCLVCHGTTLAPGANTTCSGTYLTKASDMPNDIVNSATVTGTPAKGSPPTATAQATVAFTPQPAMTKRAPNAARCI